MMHCSHPSLGGISKQVFMHTGISAGLHLARAAEQTGRLREHPVQHRLNDFSTTLPSLSPADGATIREAIGTCRYLD